MTDTATAEDINLVVRQLQGWERMPNGVDWGFGRYTETINGNVATFYEGHISWLGQEAARLRPDKSWRSFHPDRVMWHATRAEAMDAVENGLSR